MPVIIETEDDLLSLVRNNEEFRATLRRELLTQELLDLPQKFAEYTAATNERLDRIEQIVADNSKQIAENSRLIADNSKQIAENSRLIADNSKQIAENTKAIESLKETTERNAIAIESLKETTERNAIAIESLKEATERNAIAIESLKETTERNAIAIESLKEATERNAIAIESLKETTERNTKAIESLKEATERNAIAIESLKETTERNAIAIESLKEATERNAKAIADLTVEFREYAAKTDARLDRIEMLVAENSKNIDALTKQFAKYAAKTDARLDSLEKDMAIVKGYGLEGRLETKARAKIIAALKLRRTRILRLTDESRGSEDFTDALYDAERAGAISEREYNRLLDTDLILRGSRLDARNKTVYIAVEASYTNDADDLSRALSSAAVLRKVFPEAEVVSALHYAEISERDLAAAQEAGAVTLPDN